MEETADDEVAAPKAPIRRIAAARSGLIKPNTSTAGGLLSAVTPKRSAPAKPGPLNLGLNSGSCTQAQALPVRRRGQTSYQSLKRASPGPDSTDDGPSTSDSSTSATTPAKAGACPLNHDSSGISDKKKTHWEAYGTVMVLFTLFEGSAESDTALQMLSAEGYDAQVATSSDETLALFDAQAVYPDLVLIDSDHRDVDCRKLIQQLFTRNPTVAIMVLGGATTGSLTAVAALQGGAADFMHKPLDMDELVARVERHVQRQHCIKLELVAALEEAQKEIRKLKLRLAVHEDGAPPPPDPPPAVCEPRGSGPPDGPARDTALGAVAETDFEDQMSDLSEENQRLTARLQELEHELQSRMVTQ